MISEHGNSRMMCFRVSRPFKPGISSPSDYGWVKRVIFSRPSRPFCAVSVTQRAGCDSIMRVKAMRVKALSSTISTRMG